MYGLDIILRHLRSADLVPQDCWLYLLMLQYEDQCRGSLRQTARCFSVGREQFLASCHRLAAAGWLRLVMHQRSRRPLPILPVAVQVDLAQRIEEDYAEAANKGEFLMKRQLDLRVAPSCRYVDNARPDHLTSPVSDARLEYDRYHKEAKVAFEFNGAQHYAPTNTFGGDEAHKEQRTRDLFKEGLSREARVELVVITPERLKADAFKLMLPKHLPRRYVDEDGPYARAITRLCTAYADRAARSDRGSAAAATR